MNTYEVNFDGLVGLTHNYGGLSFGNLASTRNKEAKSNPKQAALQGLEKMKLCADLGLKQAVLPPQLRPKLSFLKRLGFSGMTEQILQKVATTNPHLLVASYSASSMWSANAATVSPSADTEDQRIHFTPANLHSNLHRCLEIDTTTEILKRIFSDPDYFYHHPPLPRTTYLADEGAANHMRFCDDYGHPGVEFFVYGQHSFSQDKIHPVKFPARQTYEASSSIARLHRLTPRKTIYAQQQAFAIDQGAFHNDVVAVNNKQVLLYHEQAYVDSEIIMAHLQQAMAPHEITLLQVPANQVSLEEAVNAYLFNSQLVSLPNNEMALIAPLETQETAATSAYVNELLSNTHQPIRQVHYVDCRQSMRNGGGPACLRLRVIMNEKEMSAISTNVFLSQDLYQQLTTWIKKHYRDELGIDDLLDPMLLEENYRALDELTQILQLGSLYEFQQ